MSRNSPHEKNKLDPKTLSDGPRGEVVRKGWARQREKERGGRTNVAATRGLHETRLVVRLVQRHEADGGVKDRVSPGG